MKVRDARPSVNITRKGARRSHSVDDRGGMENRNFFRPYDDRLMYGCSKIGIQVERRSESNRFISWNEYH